MAQQDVGRCFCKVIHIKKCGMLSMNIAKLCRLLFAKKNAHLYTAIDISYLADLHDPL